MCEYGCGCEVKDYCCIECLAGDITYDLIDSIEDYGSVSVIAGTHYTQQIIKAFMCLAADVGCADSLRFDLGVIKFDPEDCCGDYIVTLTSDFEVWCEPAWRDNEYMTGYIDIEDDRVYVHEDCDWGVLDHIFTDNIVIFGIEE